MKPTLDQLHQTKAALNRGQATIFTTATGLRYAVESDGTRVELPMDPRIGSKFQVDTTTWQAATRAATAVRSTNTLRIVTWNVWFDLMDNGRRFEALVSCVLAYNPDIICLQEVTPDFSNALDESAIVSETYEFSPYPVGTYGCMILARRTLEPSFQLMPLPTRMNRSLLLCKFANDECVVSTIHLESLNSESVRKIQLKLSGKALVPFRHAMLCGDFNFDDTQPYGAWKPSFLSRGSSAPLENAVLSSELPGFIDMWPLLHPNDRGATFDGTTNPICVRDRHEVMRYDRIMMKSDAWKGQQMSLLGLDAIDDFGIKPSDHYGLMLEIKTSDV
ncbi:unnamed protein product [Aphanomyces euteiches]